MHYGRGGLTVLSNQPTFKIMRVNSDHSDFKDGGEKNYAYESGILQKLLEDIARRVESDHRSAEDRVQELREKGILE